MALALVAVVVVLADMCSFSRFVRDTPNGEIIRENLTAFYSKARYQIINNGGMPALAQDSLEDVADARPL